MEKQIEVSPYNGILFSLAKEGDSGTWMTPGHFVK